MLTIANVQQALNDSNTSTPNLQPISNVVVDSRQAGPGSLFVALKGENVDGHAFVANALKTGAVAAIVEKDLNELANLTTLDTSKLKSVCIKVDNTLIALQKLATYWRNKFSPQIIGITGSIGKTSTKELTYSVLSQKYKTLKNKGNFNNEIGLPLTLLELNETHQQVILEMGMYNIGEIKTLCDIANPQIGVITNIGPSHLERLGTMERIVTAKQELVENLPKTGTAILNIDDPLVYAMRHHTQASVFTYGLSKQADLWADSITSAGLAGIRFVLHYQNQVRHVKVPLLGRHSVHTALRAAAVGLVQGLDWTQIVSGLQDKQAQLRLVAVPGPNGSILLDDTYNASPKSGIAALNLLEELTAKRKIAVLGDMAELGSHEDEGHRKVGCRAAAIVDLLITIGPKSRLTATEAIACGLNKKNVKSVDEAILMVDYLKEIATEGDIILIKGSRSMALDKIVDSLSSVATDTAATVIREKA